MDKVDEQAKKEFEDIIAEQLDFQDLAEGCILGALTGNAIGVSLLNVKVKAADPPISPVKTKASDPPVHKQARLRRAFEYPGNVKMEIGPGQVSLDGGLSLCLGHGLVAGNGILDLNKIADYYGKWFDCEPFDLGETLKRAMSKAFGERNELAQNMRRGSNHEQAKDSKSNGALMRIVALCVWASRLQRDDFIKAVSEEAKLTHTNKDVVHGNVIFAYTVKYLLNNRGDSQGAFNQALEMAKRLENEEILEQLKNILKGGTFKISKSSDTYLFTTGLYYAMQLLKANKSHREGIERAIEIGGDTDTNGYIVGAMLGALHGRKGIEEKLVRLVLDYDYEIALKEKEKRDSEKKDDEKKDLKREFSAGRKRADFLVPKICLESLMKNIIAIRPEKLKMVGEEFKEELTDGNSDSDE